MEDKKKVIVPIIIGVTVLLVLIVGATYAYFQATNTASGTTSVEASTEKIGTVIVSNPTENLYLKLSAYDMQESMKGTTYYATNDSTKNYETVGQNHVLSTATISGGEEDTVYNCTYKLTVTKPSQIQSGDMALFINSNGATIDGGASVNTDLYGASAGSTITYTVNFSHTGNGTINLLTGDIAFNNTTSEQNHLVGQTLSTTITNSDLDCSVGETSSTETLAAGLYAEDGTMTYSWDELIENNYLEVINGTLNAGTTEDGDIIGGHLNGKLVIDESVTKIGTLTDGALAAGMTFSAIIIPESVTYINDYGLSMNSNLQYVVIPKSITYIGDDILFNCQNLKNIYYTGSEEAWNTIEKSSFWNGGIPSNTQIIYNYNG